MTLSLYLEYSFISMQKNIAIILLLFFSTSSFAQELIRSNVLQTPVMLNSTFAGIEKDKMQAQTYYRESLHGVLLHQVAGVTLNTYVSEGIRQQDWIGAAVQYAFDKRGLSKYNKAEVDVNVSYHLMLTEKKNQLLSIGLLVNTTSRRVNEMYPLFGSFEGFGSLTTFEIPDEAYDIFGVEQTPTNQQTIATWIANQQTVLMQTTTPWKTKPVLSNRINVGLGVSYRMIKPKSSLDVGLSLKRLSVPFADIISGIYQSSMLNYIGSCPTDPAGISHCGILRSTDAVLFNQLTSMLHYKYDIAKKLDVAAIGIHQNTRFFSGTRMQTVLGFKPTAHKEFRLEAGVGFKYTDAFYNQFLFGVDIKGVNARMLYGKALSETIQSKLIELSIGYSFSI